MKSLVEYLNEAYSEPETVVENITNEDVTNEAVINEGEITSEKDFKEYAKKKFEEVYGDENDEDKMNEIINGIIEKCGEDWGEAVGMLNKSFGGGKE